MAVRSYMRNAGHTTSALSSLNRALILLLAHVPSLYGYPLSRSLLSSRQVSSYGPEDGILPPDKKSPSLLLYMTVSAGLVLLGGIFAGLTLALMGQDEIYLRVISQSGEENERKNAHKVLKLLQKGKHWVLVTLLLSNVITNETLPVVLDRCLGGGWPAVVTSTAAIVIFGEIIPQSVCVRYGLQIGAAFAPFVLFLMYALFIIAYPTALLLDWTLGEDHGTMYRKSGLKTLVTLHRTMGVERLNEDEVTIISAVLDLKEKPVKDIMTPIENVFTMSADDVLDQTAIDRILSAGYSRIPIHVPGQPLNFVGMLLVRILISYDPEDSMPVSSFPLATLPETAPDTSCLNILNYFQEGKSHMVIVSESPGESYGAIGVLTLEDVIEELIGEEIVDESDVYVDVHRGVRRANPLPLSKRMFSQYLQLASQQHQGKSTSEGPREISPGLNSNNTNNHKVVNSPLGSQAVHRLNPSNLAANPILTANSRVKIKPGDQVDQQLRFSSGHMSAQSRSVNQSPGLSNNKSNGDGDNDDERHENGSKESLIPGATKALTKYGSLQSDHHRQEEEGQQQQESQPKKPTKKRQTSRQSIPTNRPTATVGSANFHRACSTSPVPERSNGIVESVVNVHGFPKTVILEGGRRGDVNSKSSSTSSNNTG